MSIQESLDKLDDPLREERFELTLKGEKYVAYYFTVGYFVYKVNEPFDYPVYFVTRERCTCPGFLALGFCKHHQALKGQC